MKKILTAMAVLLLSLPGTAQVVRWSIHPAYDEIKIVDDGLYRVVKNGKYGLVGDHDKVLLTPKYDKIESFRDGYALLMSASGEVSGFCDKTGRLIDLSDKHYTIPDFCPAYFSSGWILLQRGPKGKEKLYYVDTNGLESKSYPVAKPYYEGYAVTRDDKGRWAFLDATGKEWQMTGDKGKPCNNDDVDFMASITDGSAIVVYKKRIYRFNPKTNLLEQQYENNNGKDRLEAQKDPVGQEMFRDYGKGYRVDAKGDKAVYKFDKLNRLIAQQIGRAPEQTFRIAQDEDDEQTFSSQLGNAQYPQYGNKYDLYSDNTDNQLLPPQFEDVAQRNGQNAVVKLDGQWGVIQVEDGDINFSVEKMNDFKFVHGTKTAIVFAILPPVLYNSFASDASVSLGSLDGNILPLDDMEQDDELKGTYFVSAEFDIPEDIDTVRTECVYKLAVLYDGLISTTYEVPVTAYFANNNKVEFVSSSVTGSEAVVTFTVEEEEADEFERVFEKEIKVYAADPLVYNDTPTQNYDGSYSINFTNVAAQSYDLIVDVKEKYSPLAFSYRSKLNNASRKALVDRATTVIKKDDRPVSPKPAIKKEIKTRKNKTTTVSNKTVDKAKEDRRRRIGPNPKPNPVKKEDNKQKNFNEIYGHKKK